MLPKESYKQRTFSFFQNLYSNQNFKLRGAPILTIKILKMIKLENRIK